MDAFISPRASGMRSPTVDSAPPEFTDIAPDQIVSRAMIQAKGAADFNAGRPRDSHNMNWHSPALPDWLAGHDAAAQAWAKATNKQAIVVMLEAAEV